MVVISTSFSADPLFIPKYDATADISSLKDYRKESQSGGK